MFATSLATPTPSLATPTSSLVTPTSSLATPTSSLATPPLEGSSSNTTKLDGSSDTSAASAVPSKDSSPNSPLSKKDGAVEDGVDGVACAMEDLDIVSQKSASLETGIVNFELSTANCSLHVRTFVYLQCTV